MPKAPGHLITLEGLDGCGKSTQVDLLVCYLRERGHTVVATREPGGTLIGQQIREVLLNASEEPITALTELALMFAARAQHIEHVIGPALRRGEIVVCDRFTDSSVAYQGYGRGVPLDAIAALEKSLCQDLRPDLTLILDLDVATSVERAGTRNRKVGQPDTRFEQEDWEFFERVRQGYLAIARQEPARVRLVNAGVSIERLAEAIRAATGDFLQRARSERMAGEAHGV
jgi:dTMP kinase